MKNKKLLIIILAAIITLLIKVIPLNEKSIKIKINPIYEQYTFGASETVIDIGMQPLATPEGIISTVMFHDEILVEELKKLGYTIKFHSFFKGSDLNIYLGNGSLEVGSSGDMPTLVAASNFGVVVAALAHLGFASIVSTKRDLISDLKGKKIAYALGSNAFFSLLTALSIHNLTEEDVKLIPMDVSQMPAALSNGDVDAFSAWEPTPSISIKEAPDNIVLHRGLISSFLYFKNSFAKQHPEALRVIVASHIRSLRWMNKSTENLIKACDWGIEGSEEFLGEEMLLSTQDYSELVKSEILNNSPWGRIPENLVLEDGLLAKEFEFLKSRNKLPVDADMQQTLEKFDLSIVDDIVAQPKKYKLDSFSYKDLY